MKYAITSLLATAILAGCAVNSGTTPAGGVVPKSESPEAKTESKAATRPLKPTQRVDAFIKSIDNNKNNFSNRIVQVAAFLDEPDFATNAANRAYVREKIAEMCLTPP